MVLDQIDHEESESGLRLCEFRTVSTGQPEPAFFEASKGGKWSETHQDGCTKCYWQKALEKSYLRPATFVTTFALPTYLPAHASLKMGA